jgi:putative transcriptional regulator
MMHDDIPDLTEKDFDRTLVRAQRQRLMAGDIQSGRDIADLRAFVGLTQAKFAAALGISVRTLQGWEQGRRLPEGPSLALLRIAARHPKIIRENLASAA